MNALLSHVVRLTLIHPSQTATSYLLFPAKVVPPRRQMAEKGLDAEADVYPWRTLGMGFMMKNPDTIVVSYSITSLVRSLRMRLLFATLISRVCSLTQNKLQVD